MMKFNKLLRVIGIESDDERVVHEITTCHKKAREGVLFVAMRGVHFDSNIMIDDALQQGAMVIGNVMKDHVVFVDDSKVVLALLAEAFYGYPHRFLKMIAITGTSGKSSVSHYIALLLRMNGKRVAVIGSDGIFIEEKYLPTTNTTPSSLLLSRTLHDCIASDIEYVVMEASSHAIEQSRVKGLYFNVVLFLNLGYDHLDYHPSLVQYRQSKAKLLNQLKKNGIVLVNGDDEQLPSLTEEAARKLVMYGQEQGEYRIKDIKLRADGSVFVIEVMSGGLKNERRSTVHASYQICTKLLGVSNVYNVMAAILACHTFGLPLSILAQQASGLRPLAGRMEVVYQKDFTVMVDYAHTVDAFQQLGQFVGALDVKRRVIVMGLGGDRDKGKRPLIGKILQEWFDVILLTSDNPRSENPLYIIGDVCEGSGYDKVRIEVDRKRAIEVAIQEASVGDIIVIAGKGNESFQVIGDVRLPFVDKDVVLQSLLFRDGVIGDGLSKKYGIQNGL